MTTSTRAVFVGVAVAASLVAPATARGDGIMLVSAGAFWMGRDDGPAEERPRHRVFVTDFWIERHKVTNAEFDDGGRPLVAAISDPANRLSILRMRGCSETDQVDPGVGVVLVVAALALGRDDALSVEEVGELGVGHLVTLDPEVGDEHAVPRPLLGGAVVTAHPERAGLHQH